MQHKVIFYLSIIILPDTSSDLVSTQIEGLEFDFPNAQFLRRRMLRRLVLHQSLRSHKRIQIKNQRKNKIQKRRNQSKVASGEYLVFEHVKESGLSGIIETEKENLSFLLPETKRCENPVEPIEEKHGFESRSNGSDEQQQSMISKEPQNEQRGGRELLDLKVSKRRFLILMAIFSFSSSVAVSFFPMETVPRPNLKQTWARPVRPILTIC